MKIISEITNKEYTSVEECMKAEAEFKAAKEAALEKFNDNLDDILDRFNDNLDNTSRIYSSIREAITRCTDSGREFIVKI